MSDLLSDALAFAIEAHRGQLDKANRPYIRHVLAVIAECDHDPQAMAVAALHDVVEDTDATIDDVDAFGEPWLTRAVAILTRVKESETYKEYINRIAASENPLAKRVKLADLAVNLRTWKPEYGEGLYHRYRRAQWVLRRALP